MIIGFFIFGICKSRNMMTILFNMENCPSQGAPKSLALIFSVDSSSPLYYCLFVLVISKNTYNLFYFINALGITAFITFALVIKESPKWLILKGRNKEAVDAINYIARFNGVEGPVVSDDTILFID